MKTKELVDRIAAITGESKKETKAMLTATAATMKELLLEGHKLVFSGFGAFEMIERKARAGVNPKTLEKLTIPARKAVKFKASKKLKNLLN